MVCKYFNKGLNVKIKDCGYIQDKVIESKVPSVIHSSDRDPLRLKEGDRLHEPKFRALIFIF